MLLFDLKSNIDQEVAEAYAGGLYDVYRLRDRCGRDLTPQEIQTERKCAFVFDKFYGNPVIDMPKNISKSYEGY